MRKPVLLIFTNACILIVVFLLLAQSLFIVQRVAIARRVKGQVAVQHDGTGAFLPLRDGQGVRSGDEVRTGAHSEAEFAWQDGTRWQMAPDSRLVIQSAQLNPAKNNETSRLRLERGQLTLRLVKPLALTSSLEIETPKLVVSARGAVLNLAVENNATQVQVLEGETKVIDTASAREITLIGGQQLRASMLQLQVSTFAAAAPSAQSALLQPDLTASAQQVSADSALLRGHTEVGNAVTIDGARVAVLGTGDFVRRVKLGAAVKGWKIESTDRFGAKTSLYQALPGACVAAK